MLGANHTHGKPEPIFGLDDHTSLIIEILLSCVLVLFAGMMSGLTLGLLSLGTNTLKPLAATGPPAQRARATRLLSLLENPHWVLVTLLVCNAGAVESLPLILDLMVNPIVTVALSTVMVLIFGEIFPQSIFVRWALPIGAFFVYPVRALMWITSPISWPLAYLLDHIVGHRSAIFFRRQQLRQFILLQYQDALAENEKEDGDDSSDDSSSTDSEQLTTTEVKMMLGALSLSECTIGESMKSSLDEVLMLEDTSVLDIERVQRLFQSGYSRIPIYHAHRENVTHYLEVKKLCLLIYHDEAKAPTVKDCKLKFPLFRKYNELLNDLYYDFQKGEGNICVVLAGNGEAIGIITMEDVFEKLHQASILDETDLTSKKPVQLIMKQWKEGKKGKKIDSLVNKRWSREVSPLMRTEESENLRNSAQRRLTYGTNDNRSFTHENTSFIRRSSSSHVGDILISPLLARENTAKFSKEEK